MRQVRDVIGEAMRRALHGDMKPPWPQLDEAARERWRASADRLVQIARVEGVRFERPPEERGAT